MRPRGESTYFLAVNRNKRGLGLDLATEEGRAAPTRWRRRADVLVENFTPGTMEHFGLGYEEMAGANPGLIYASVTGFGRGAGARLPGYDFLIQAVGGLMSITGEPDGAPTKVGVALVDVLAGQHARRRRPRRPLRPGAHRPGPAGRGQPARQPAGGPGQPGFGVPERGRGAGPAGQRAPEHRAYETVPTRDRPIAIAVGNDRQWQRLSAVLHDMVGASPLDEDPRFKTNPDRVRHAPALAEALAARMRLHPADLWVETLTAAGVPCGLVSNVEEAFALAGSLGIEAVVRQPRPDGTVVASVANPVTFSRTPVSYRLAPPPPPD